MSRALEQRLALPTALVWLILEAAAHVAREGVRIYRRRTRKRRGSTLRPGIRTPLWNELRKLVRREMRFHGDRAVLGREIGVPRQRIHEFLRAGSAMPDAERTLELLGWLARGRQVKARRAVERRRPGR